MQVVDILNNIINQFSIDKFEEFFRSKNDNYEPADEDIPDYIKARYEEDFSDVRKIGQMQCDGIHELIVVAACVTKSLTERSGKKAQYELGKKIIRHYNRYTGGFFIFYDDYGNFRFSFIYSLPQPGGTQVWSNFRRYTYYVSKEQTNRTFLQQMEAADFNSVASINEAFSVEKVTKEFYQKVVSLYYTLLQDNKNGIICYPNQDKKNKQEFGIRLLGRLVFCWFLKKKRGDSNCALIPDAMLSSQVVNNYEDFYHELLEPLFFQVLNTPIELRLDDFKKGDFAKVPFLNGGLFEPHDGDMYNPNEMGISQFINTLKINNNWFKKVFELFEMYNFTIDENTVDDAEISIDPEMLGKIFENLLAEITPETGESARKATGSYYTPRIIVDYMVNESLKHYLIERTNLQDDVIEKLLQQDDEELNLSEYQKDAIITALDEIKVLDPACGSGAFPMGMLHKMVTILQKVDPNSQKWLIKKLERIPDPLVRKELEQKIQGENWDYIHKLGIIQNSIYGVDIQTIAIEISKLRFFLSLIVDEKIDDSKPNRGIIPLPNLEFKFVAANTLISLQKVQNTFAHQEDLINQLKQLRNEYFSAYGNRKREIEQEFIGIQNTLFQQAVQWQSNEEQSFALSQWEPFTFKSNSWFDPEWMFGVKKEIIEERKEWKAFNITWVTHNSRRRETDMPSKTQGEDPVILNYEDRQAVAQILAKRIKEKEYRVLAMNVLEDHVHILLVAEKNEVPKIIQDLKGYSSYAYHLLKATHGATHGDATHLATHGLTRGLQGDTRGLQGDTRGLQGDTRGMPEHTGHTEDTNHTQQPSTTSGAHYSIPATPTYADGTKQKLWAKSYSDTYIQDEVHLINAIEYIKNNHNKHNILPIDFTRFNEVFTPLEKAFQPVIKETGFDIVIGNPPYIQLQKAYNKNQKYGDLYKEQHYEVFKKTGDIYCLFYEKGIQLLKQNGILAYITSNKWMRAGYGEKLREFFAKYNPLQLIDLGPGVFENATVDTNILLIQKSKNQNNLTAVTYTNKNQDIAQSLKEKGVILTRLNKDAWFIGNQAEQKLKEKIESIGKPLKDWDVNIYRGILTGLNDAFIITTEKRNEILANCQDEDERRRTEAIIKPILRGRDIKRYYYEWAGLWVIGTFPALHLNIEDYPALKKYFLDNFDKRQLEQSGKKYPQLGFDARKKTGNKWFETQDQIAYYPEFEKEKVVYSEIVRSPQFYLDNTGFYVEATSFLMTGEHVKYICGLLNSKPVTFFFKRYYAGGGLGEEGYRYKKAFLENLPIPPITKLNKAIVNQIEALVYNILEAKKQNKNADTSQWEREIDALVYRLYDLTEEEIRIVEGGE